MRMVLLASALALTACGSDRERAITDDEGTEVGTYSIEDGETSASLRLEDGSVTAMRSGSRVPVDLPAGFSVAPGLTVLNTTNVERGDGRYAMLTMQGSQPVDDIVAYYRREAEAAGVDINVDVTTGGSTTIAGEGADGLAFSLMASGNDDEVTAVQLTVSRGLD